MLFGTFWNFVPPNIFNPVLVESADMKPAQMDGQLNILYTLSETHFV